MYILCVVTGPGSGEQVDLRKFTLRTTERVTVVFGEKQDVPGWQNLRGRGQQEFGIRDAVCLGPQQQEENSERKGQTQTLHRRNKSLS